MHRDFVYTVVIGIERIIARARFEQRGNGSVKIIQSYDYSLRAAEFVAYRGVQSAFAARIAYRSAPIASAVEHVERVAPVVSDQRGERNAGNGGELYRVRGSHLGYAVSHSREYGYLGEYVYAVGSHAVYVERISVGKTSRISHIQDRYGDAAFVLGVRRRGIARRAEGERYVDGSSGIQVRKIGGRVGRGVADHVIRSVERVDYLFAGIGYDVVAEVVLSAGFTVVVRRHHKQYPSVVRERFVCEFLAVCGRVRVDGHRIIERHEFRSVLESRRFGLLVICRTRVLAYVNALQSSLDNDDGDLDGLHRRSVAFGVENVYGSHRRHVVACVERAARGSHRVDYLSVRPAYRELYGRSVIGELRHYSFGQSHEADIRIDYELFDDVVLFGSHHHRIFAYARGRHSDSGERNGTQINFDREGLIHCGDTVAERRVYGVGAAGEGVIKTGGIPGKLVFLFLSALEQYRHALFVAADIDGDLRRGIVVNVVVARYGFGISVLRKRARRLVRGIAAIENVVDVVNEVYRLYLTFVEFGVLGGGAPIVERGGPLFFLRLFSREEGISAYAVEKRSAVITFRYSDYRQSAERVEVDGLVNASGNIVGRRSVPGAYAYRHAGLYHYAERLAFAYVEDGTD